MVERKVTVVNPTGLHLRPAGLLCQTSMKFDSKVMIFYKEKEINAKSVLNVMASGIRCGDEITSTVTDRTRKRPLKQSAI